MTSQNKNIVFIKTTAFVIFTAKHFWFRIVNLRENWIRWICESVFGFAH